MEQPYLQNGLGLTPETIRNLVSRTTEDRIDRRFVQDRFTVREVIAHMADFEPVMKHRILKALAEPGSDIEIWNEDEEAERQDYGSWNVEESLDLFDSRRKETLAELGKIEGPDWVKGVVHPVAGPRSIFELAVMLLGHDTYHIHQISQYLAENTF